MFALCPRGSLSFGKFRPATFRRCAMFSAALLAGLALAAHAQAQQYRTIPPQLSERAAKQLTLIVAQALRNPQNFQQDKTEIDAYFKKYYFPKMTSTLPADLGLLAKRREDLFKRYIRSAQVKAAQEYLTDMTLKITRSIAQGNYHPAVRYNAVLILGELDQQYTVPPVPLPAGTNALLELLEKEDFKGVKVPASVRLGALVGLARHARFGIDAQYADRVTKAALGLIAEEQSPADLAPEVHHWMKCQAARILANQYAQKPNPQIQSALTAMIADSKMNLEDRCCMAALLKKFKYEAAEGIDGTATLVALGGLTKDVVSDEASLARDYQKAVLQSAPATGRGGFGRIPSGAGSAGPKYQRRRLLARLKAVTDGAQSLQAILPDAAKEQLKSLITPLASVMQTAADKNALDLDVTRQVLELASEIDNVVNGWQQPANAAKKPA